MKHYLTPLRLLVALGCLLGGSCSAFSQDTAAADAADEAAQKIAWEKCKAELLAKGERLDLSWFTPPPVPDDKNFALTPLLKPVLDLVKDPKTGGFTQRDPDMPVGKISIEAPGATKTDNPKSKSWETGNARNLEAWQAYYRKWLPDMKLSKSPAEDMLAVLGRFDGMFAELRGEMKARPLCRYPLHYELGMEMSMPHYAVLQNLVKVLSYRASAELAQNRPDEAFADLEFGFRLTDTFSEEPSLIAGLVRIALANTLLQAVWEGIASHRWNAEQLAALEKDLQGVDYLSNFNRCMRYERAELDAEWPKLNIDPQTSIAKLEGIKKEDVKQNDAALRASFYSNQIIINTTIQEKFLGIFDEKKQIVNLNRAKDAKMSVQKLRVEPTFLSYVVMSGVYDAATTKFAQMQTYANEGAIACEIERYRLAHGKLPDTLEALQMEGLPHDVVNGQPLHYRVDDEGNYTLNSEGWDGNDQAGKIVLKANGAVDYEQGDWVWTLKPQ